MRKVLLLLFVLSFSAQAQIPEQRDSLKGLSGVRVRVLLNEPEMVDKIGYKAIRTDTELKLRKAGIRVYDDSYPELRISIRTAHSDNMAAIALRVSVVTLVSTRGTNPRDIFASIWEASVTGLVPLDEVNSIREQVADAVDEFINDYLAANPKR
jgi:hypothetical protein